MVQLDRVTRRRTLRNCHNIVAPRQGTSVLPSAPARWPAFPLCTSRLESDIVDDVNVAKGPWYATQNEAASFTRGQGGKRVPQSFVQIRTEELADLISFAMSDTQGKASIALLNAKRRIFKCHRVLSCFRECRRPWQVVQFVDIPCVTRKVKDDVILT